MDLELSSATSVIVGTDGGKYPYGNSVLVRGSLGAVLIDPSLSVHERGGVGCTVDRVLVSHAHEDHLAGVGLFPAASVHAHHEDLLGLHSLEGFMTVYGMPPEIEAVWKPEMVEQFHYVERPDAMGFAEGDRFELGDRTVTCLHLAGHTRGHSGFFVEQDGVFFVGDIDLTGFGPYYGDHWSDLESFEAAILRVREIEARWYVTFHQKGVIEGQDRFVEMLDAFMSVITNREVKTLEFLCGPRRIADMVSNVLRTDRVSC